MILVTGANGRIGRLLVDQLLNQGQDVRVFVRDRLKAEQHFGASVEIAVGDLDDIASIHRAIAGSTGIFLCCPVNPDQVNQQNAVIDAAKLMGQPYVVKLSGLASFEDSFVDSGRWHAETEHYLAASGLPFTCLHPYFFMQNLGFQLNEIKRTGAIRSAVTQAPVAMVDAADIAAVAAALLQDQTTYAGETLPLTCSNSVTYSDIAETMSDLFAQKISFKPLSMDQVEANLIKAGQPDWHIKILLQFNRAFNEGYGAAVHPAVQNILGREPISLAAYLKTASTPTNDSDPFPA